MSFATYKSPFDEALSKPLIQDNGSDTQSVTTTTTASSSQQRSSSSSVSNTSAAYSKKLTVNHNDNYNNSASASASRPPPPRESFSKFNIDGGNTSHSTNPFDDEPYSSSSSSYHPPSLTLDHPTQSTSEYNSLEAALLRERNEESKSILQKMNTINAISSELNSLVQSQQETIDDVEQNAIGVHDNTESGVRELEQANGMMRKNGGSGVEVFWKFFFGVIGVGGLIIAFVIFLHSL